MAQRPTLGRKLLLTSLATSLAAAAMTALPLAARAQASNTNDTPPALTDYSLEQLMELPFAVSSVTKKPQRIEDTAAAIYVISREDIHRSGMTSLPDLLRQVPGLQVAHIDGSTMAVSSRGFNAKNSDNLLIMLDGRTIYTPTFTGVYWDSVDFALENIERIEVVRGSGGALWGANAVTGVINIISRSAAATQGSQVSIAGGNLERQLFLRHGITLGADGHLRLSAKASEQGAFRLGNGQAAADARDLGSFGFRADWGLRGGSSLTVQGDVLRGNADHTGSLASLLRPGNPALNYGIHTEAANLLLRWRHVLSPTSEWSLQAYLDHYQRSYINFDETRTTADLDFHHRLRWGERHDLVWGGGLRQTQDKMGNTFVVSYLPAERRDRTANLFVQDEISLIADRLHLIAGTRLEHNDYTGFEYQPNLRLRWKLDERQTLWAAVSRAVHSPSRTDSDGRVVATVLPGKPATVLMLTGNPDIRSERVNSWEIGYRTRPNEQVQMDLALFYSEHHGLMTIEPRAAYLALSDPLLVPGPPISYLVRPLQLDNLASARSMGLGWSGSWRPNDRWQIKSAWSWLQLDIGRDALSRDTSIESEVGRSPRNQFNAQVHYTPGNRSQLTASLYHVGKLASLNVPAYTRLDLRYAYRLRHDLELSLTGRNLLDPQHPEFINVSGPKSSEVPRSVIAAATWTF